MIDPATGQFEILQYNDKNAAKIENIVYQEFIFGYKRPKIIIYNWGIELLGNVFKHYLIKIEY